VRVEGESCGRGPGGGLEDHVLARERVVWEQRFDESAFNRGEYLS